MFLDLPLNESTIIEQSVENMETKGEIARFEQFLLLSPCFQKGVSCNGVRKRLYGLKESYVKFIVTLGQHLVYLKTFQRKKSY